MRCGRRGGGGRECTHEYAHLYAYAHSHTHTHAHILQQAHVQPHTFPHKHAAISVSTRNPCTHPCKQTPSVYWYRYYLLTLVHHAPHSHAYIHTKAQTRRAAAFEQRTEALHARRQAPPCRGPRPALRSVLTHPATHT